MPLKPEINEAQTEGGGLTVKPLVIISMAATRNEAQSEWAHERKSKNILEYQRKGGAYKYLVYSTPDKR